MHMLSFFPLLAIVPIAILLTVSFFVLVVLRKIEEKGLRAFGYVAASFLWLAALVVFAGAVYNLAKLSPSPRCMMLQKMKCPLQMMSQRMGEMPQMMPTDKMSSPDMPDKDAALQGQKGPGAVKCCGNKGNIFKSE